MLSFFLENQIKTNKNTERQYYQDFTALEKQKNETSKQLQNINWVAELRLDKKILISPQIC